MRLAALAAALVLVASHAGAQAPQPPQTRTPQSPRGASQPSTAGVSLPLTGVPQPSPAAGSQARASQPGQAPRGRRTLQVRFDEANTTHDGHLTLEQARAGRMVAVARDFAAIDTAQKGYVTVDDIKAHRRAMRLARKAAKQG